MISVVIPTYKRSKYIKRAVMSVFAQTYKDIEIIVVDDNGLGTEEQVLTSNEVNELVCDGLNVKYIAHDVNKGGCAARNSGIKVAQGEFVALLDDDDEWLPTFLEKLVEKMEDSNVGAVYSMNYVRIDGKIYDESKKQTCKRGNVYDDLISGWCVTSTSFFLLRKSFVDAVNGFDESLQSFQDYDMWVRMAKVCDFDYVAEHLVIKENGHSDEQVAVNPVRRQAGLNTLNEKMQRTLSANDYELFKPFVDKQNNAILYTRIAQGKQKKEKLNYFALYKEYASKEKNSIKRVIALITVLFGIKTSNYMRILVLKLTGKMKELKI